MENKLELRKLRKQISDLIYEKHLNEYEKYKLNYFIEEYKKLDNDRTPFVYIALTKYYLTIDNIKLAQENLRKAESINSDLPSISYLNYRINVRLGNYENAYKDLRKYEEKNKANNSRNIDLSIYYYLLNLVLNNTENMGFDNQEYINSIKIVDPNFKSIWDNFRKSILSKKYSISKELVSKLNRYCKSHNILLNFDEINMLIDKIILCRNNNKNSIEEEINYIKKLIDEDILDFAEEKLNDIKQFVNYKSKKIQIDLLKRYLNEKKEIELLKESNLYDTYEKFKNDGKINYYYNDYYTAYQYFTAGYYLTGVNEFKFYAARCLLMLGKTKEATQLFLEYNEKGYSKLIRSYNFLIYNKLFSNSQIKKLKKDKALFKSIINPDNISENFPEIQMHETFEANEQFHNTNVILDQFENYSNIDKLKYIKYLYQHSYKNIADKLLKQYEKQFVQDKEINKQLFQLRKNRTLYINQVNFSK